MYQTIVVATDGSTHADEAVRVAARLAAADGARLVVVHVMEEGALPDDLRHMAEVEHLKERQPGIEYRMAGVPGWMSDVIRQTESVGTDHLILEKVGRMALERAMSIARDTGATEVADAMEAGQPARQILAVAQREKADLVVLGSRGLSDFTGLVFGSVSHRVAHLCPCTCLTVTS